MREPMNDNIRKNLSQKTKKELVQIIIEMRYWANKLEQEFSMWECE